MKKISPKFILSIVLILSLVTVMPAAAGTVTTIDFENLAHYEQVTTQYPGLTFSGTVIVLERPYYNYGGYPPSSGNKIVDLMNGGCRINFNVPVSRVGIKYTSYYNAYLEAYNSDGVMIGHAVGPANYGSTGHLTVSGSNIAYVVIHDQGDHIGFDDLEYETSDTNIPEYPSIVLPIAAIMGLMFIFQRRKE